MYELKVEGAFEAAHQIKDYPGKCARLHGHNWVVQAVVRGCELDSLGMLIDFRTVKALLGEVLERFDHRYLNELAPFSEGVNPTAEQLARIIYEALVAKAPFAETATVRLAAITVWESPKSSVTYTPE